MEMASRKRNGLSVVSLALVVIATLALVPCPGYAGPADEICDQVLGDPGYSVTQDTDSDGITDKVECDGFTTAGISGNSDGTPITGFIAARTPDSNGSTLVSDPAKRNLYLDPTSKDLFFILVYTTGGRLELAVESLGGLDKALDHYSRGLGITPHRLGGSSVYGDRVVIRAASNGGTLQRAVRITEYTDGNAGALGETIQGTPNGLDDAKIFTERIYNVVYQYCPTTITDDTTSCKDISNAAVVGRTNLWKYYIQQVLSHEVSHAAGLIEPATKANGNHYSQQGLYIMEPQIRVVNTYTGSGQNKTITGATFYIRTGYRTTDPGAARLSGGQY